MPKISQFPAQTGASVANGDLFPIVDVGSPNVSEYITADELAQIPQLTSRYKPLASDVIYLPAGAMNAVSGSPAIGTLGNATNSWHRKSAFLLDSAALEIIEGTLVVPPSWTTADVYLWWSNAGSGSGNAWIVVWKDRYVDDESTDAVTFVEQSAKTAPAQYVAKRTLLASSNSVTAGGVFSWIISRDGGNASDTLGNDIGILGLELVRAS